MEEELSHSDHCRPHSCVKDEEQLDPHLHQLDRSVGGADTQTNTNTDTNGHATVLTKNQKKRLKDKDRAKRKAQAQAQAQAQSTSESVATAQPVNVTDVRKTNGTLDSPENNPSVHEQEVQSQTQEDVALISDASCEETKEAPISIPVESYGIVAESSPAVPFIEYVDYLGDSQLPDIMRLIAKDLSEPYSVYTYRYFLHSWPHLCILAKLGEQTAGVVVCKAERERECMRGYIAMLTVDIGFRKLGIGSTLVSKVIERMVGVGCDEVVLEAEVCNKGALALYEKLGFMRDERLSRYYLNGGDAFRLKLWIYRDRQLTSSLTPNPNPTQQPKQKPKSKAKVAAKSDRKSSDTSTNDPATHVR